MKVNCRYIVVDFYSAEVLAMGEKLKDVDFCEENYLFGGVFRTHLFWGRKVTTFYNDTIICGYKRVLIVYWLGLKKITRENVITLAGSQVGMKGKSYSINKRPFYATSELALYKLKK